MQSFNANQKVKLPDGRDILIVDVPPDDALPKIGENILVNGEVYQLQGIESGLTSHRRLSPAGFLVRKVEP